MLLVLFPVIVRIVSVVVRFFVRLSVHQAIQRPCQLVGIEHADEPLGDAALAVEHDGRRERDPDIQ